MGTVNGSKSTSFANNANITIQTNVHRSDWMGFLDALGWMESNDQYGAKNSVGYTGRYQFGQDQLDYMHFLDGVGKELFGLTTKAALVGNPIAQELAGIMEFSGVPDVNGNFVSKYTAVRIAAQNLGLTTDNFKKLIGKKFTINFLDANNNVVHTDTVTLTQAGISAAAHLVGQGTMGKAMVEIYNNCFDRLGQQISYQVSLPTIGYADGNSVAFSTYVKLLQNYDISSLINAQNGFSGFDALVEPWLAYQKNDILKYIEDKQLNIRIMTSSGYKNTILSILNGLDLSTDQLDSIDGDIVICSSNPRSYTNENDLIFGLSKSDTLIGGAGSDVLYGGGGDDVLMGNDGYGNADTEADILDGTPE